MADLHFSDGDGGTVVVHGREADTLWTLTDGFGGAKVSACDQCGSCKEQTDGLTGRTDLCNDWWGSRKRGSVCLCRPEAFVGRSRSRSRTGAAERCDGACNLFELAAALKLSIDKFFQKK